MADPAADEPVDVRVRRRLRELRSEQGLTLQQVAERALIDVSTLSRLESGKRRLALDHIPALAAALGVRADDLLGTPPPQDPRVRSKPRRYDGMTMWPLSQRSSVGGLHAYKVLISTKRRRPPDVATLHVHEGHDWIYVLTGRLRLMLVEPPAISLSWVGVVLSTRKSLPTCSARMEASDGGGTEDRVGGRRAPRARADCWRCEL